MEQPNRFQKLVADAKTRIKEIPPDEARRAAENGALLIDVREESDFRAAHAAAAMHLSKGVLELEIEEQAPDLNQPIICYCGGGSRAALAADNLQKMGYRNVKSIAGGLRAWKAAGLPTAKG